MEVIEYDSKSVGNKRKAVVYTPPHYSAETQYPVLYLLHGIGGDEQEWRRGGHPEIILDNLIADKKAVPMIIVMPNGRAQKDDRPGPNAMETAPARPAAIPISSSAACGVSTKRATPTMPTMAATTDKGWIGAFRRSAAMKTTIKGWTAATVAATPPGSR